MAQSKRTLALAIVGPLAVVLSCGGSSPKGVQEASSQAEVVEAAPSVATSAAPKNPVATDVAVTPVNERRILDYVPETYGLLMHLSIAKVAGSEFFATHERTLFGDLEQKRQDVVKACHFDPVLDIQSVTLGLDVKNTNSPDILFALTTSVGASQVEQCVIALGGKVEEGRYVVGGDSVSYYWPTDDVLLLSTENSSEGMRNALQAGRAIDNPVLMQYLSRTDRHATLWGGGAIPPSAASALGGMGGVPSGYVIRGSLWAGLDINLEISFNSSSDADGMMKLIKMGLSAGGQSSPVSEIIQSIEYEQIGTSIRIDAQFSPELSAEIVRKLQ